MEATEIDNIPINKAVFFICFPLSITVFGFPTERTPAPRALWQLNLRFLGYGKMEALELLLEDSRIGDLIHEVNFALISREHELDSLRISRVLSGDVASGYDRVVD